MRELPRPITGRLLKTRNKISINIFVLLLFLFTLLASPVQAAGELIDVDVAALPAKSALEAFHTQTGIDIEWSMDEVDGRTSNAVSGSMSAEQALEIMLAESGLQATPVDDGTFVISPSRTTRLTQAAAETDEEVLEEVIVTGSQIKGAAINDALSISVISAVDIDAMGLESGDELLDAMPEQGQNFFNEAENITGSIVTTANHHLIHRPACLFTALPTRLLFAGISIHYRNLAIHWFFRLRVQQTLVSFDTSHSAIQILK